MAWWAGPLNGQLTYEGTGHVTHGSVATTKMAAAVSGGVCWVFLIFSVFSSCLAWFGGGETFKRQVSIELNPGAPMIPPGGDLLHLRAVGGNDTLHYLYCSQGAPTLLLVHTNSSSSSLKVDWKQFLARNTSGSVRVEPESSIQYSSGVVFSRLWEYDDVNDTADPTSDLLTPYELQNFTWSRLNLSGPVSLLCGSPSNAKGSFCLQLSVFDSEGRGQSWPRLIHTANSSQVKVWLDGILPRTNHSRFMLELEAVGEAYPLSRVEVRQSIDDEYTPSIFKVSQWVSSVNGSSDVLGYIQWKPVAYRKSHPTMEDATPCRHSDPQPQSSEMTAAASGLIQAFYSHPESYGLNMSFGLAGEPFYNSTRFLSWTVLVGVGSPPVDSFSALVVVIMAVGLGTPVVILLLGGLWVCIRKRGTSSSSAYEPIN